MYQEYRPSRFQILPPVVKNLLIINGIMFLATVVLQDRFNIELAEILGLHYPKSDEFNTFQLVSHLFMHGSFLHLFSNMFALWMFGNMLENLWGSKRFFIFYFVTGLGAALSHLIFTGYEVSKMQEAITLYASDANAVDFRMLVERYKGLIHSDQIDFFNRTYSDFVMNPSSKNAMQGSVDAANLLLKNKMDIPTVGASGAVFGVLLAFGMLFPNTLLYIYFAIPIKAKYFVALYGLFELYSGFQNSAGDNVAHFAHLGGMLFGFILIKYWNKHNRNRFY
jgi:membrane associated rhomboid family serine protease